MADIWHFPRTELAKKLLAGFDTNLSSSYTIFAPRRMGKTEFIRKDVTPLAEQHGWQVFYFSFFEVRRDPVVEFSEALLRFSHGKGLIGKLKKKLSTVKSIGGTAAGNGASIAFDAGSETLTALFERVASSGKMIMLLDEIQVLATVDSHGFVSSLRTALDMYKDDIKTIFTGSSREGLDRMFSRAEAPFFHFSTNIELPNLGRSFTDHLALAVKAATQRDIDKEAAWQAFSSLGFVPQMIRSAIEKVVLNPGMSIGDATTAMIREVSASSGFEKAWSISRPLDQVIMKRLVTQGSEIYSEQARKEIALEAVLDKVDTPAIQNSLRRLKKRGLIYKPPAYGAAYEIEDALFKEWLRVLRIKSVE